jgi:hypothetical protein
MTEMADYESLLAERFAALAIPDRGDWLDVRRRARRMRRRRAALVLAATVAAIAVAAPALGFHGVVVDWFQAEPASQRTQLDFLRLGVIAPPGMDPGVIPNSARKVMTVQFKGRPHMLAVAPTKSGGFCWQWVRLSGSCVRDRNEVWRGGNDPRDVNLFALGAGFMADEEGTVSLVDGRLLDERIEHLTLEYEDGQSADSPFIWVSPPIDAGFYFFEIPEERQRPGRRAHALLATDGDGKLVARMIFPIPRPEDIDRTVRLPDGEVTQLPANSLIEQARRIIDFRAANNTRISVWLVPRAGDPPCYVHRRGRDCLHERLEAHPLGAGMRGGAEPVLIAGLVREDVATYELRYEDGDVERVEPVESFVMHEIPTRHYAPGHRLERIRALDRSGALLAQLPVRTDAFGVYPCEQPVDVGHGVMACP